MPKRARSPTGAPASKKASSSASNFRERKRIKAGVITYDLKPKDASALNFSELEVPKAWPARREESFPLLPTGSPTYEAGQVVHFGAIVPSNCLMRFDKECLRGLVSLVMDTVVAADQPPGEARVLPLSGVAPLAPAAAPVAAGDNDDVPLAGAAAAAAVDHAPHQVIPESPSGPILPFVEKIEIMLHNTVVKTIELTGNALQRQHGLGVRSAKKKYGPDFESSPYNYVLPLTRADLDPANPSEHIRKVAEALRLPKNALYVGKSPVYGFPFEYDPVLKTIHDREKLDTFYFGPGTHFEVRIQISAKARGLRMLTAANEAGARAALWARRQRVKLQSLWLAMKKICFPPGSAFLRMLEAEMKKNGGRDYPFVAYNELRHPVLSRMSEQEWPFSLQQLGLPSYLIFYFDTSDGLEGSNGHNVNTTVYRFPPNLESLNVTYQGESLLPGGQVTKLDMPGTDTADKLAFYEHQAKFRRVPGTYDTFFDDGTQQYVVIPMTDLYLQDSKMFELDKVHLKLKFSNDLSPEGWQIGVVSAAEKKLTLKSSGEHVVTNSTGKPQT